MDNNITKPQLKNPVLNWNNFNDCLVETTGSNKITFIQSWYAFLEFAGLTKKYFKKILKIQLNNRLSIEYWKKTEFKNNNEHINKLNHFLNEIFIEKAHHIEKKLNEHKSELLNAIKKNDEFLKNWIGKKELIDTLFKDILNLSENDYPLFAKELARTLTWDWFCCITIENINVFTLRKIQIGIWYHLFKRKLTFPLGKLIDDLENSNEILTRKNSNFKNKKDMVDSEMITYLILGYEKQKITVFTQDNYEVINQRLALTKAAIAKIETILKVKIKQFHGKVYYLDKDLKLLPNL